MHSTALRLIGLACAGALVIAATKTPPIQLWASPNPAFVGQPVSFTATLPAGILLAGSHLFMDFGDGSKRVAVRAPISASHVYTGSGTYDAELLEAAGAPPEMILAKVRVTVKEMHVVGVALSWPDGSQALALSGPSAPPQPLAVVQVDGPGTFVVEWLLDGFVFSVATQTASSTGDVRLTLEQPLPNLGVHQLSLNVISPVGTDLDQATPPPPLTYTYGSN
jgi:hypothetical protein